MAFNGDIVSGIKDNGNRNHQNIKKDDSEENEESMQSNPVLGELRSFVQSAAETWTAKNVVLAEMVAGVLSI